MKYLENYKLFQDDFIQMSKDIEDICLELDDNFTYDEYDIRYPQSIIQKKAEISGCISITNIKKFRSTYKNPIRFYANEIEDVFERIKNYAKEFGYETILTGTVSLAQLI